MNVLLTGAAGFCGMHVARRLLDEGHDVVGLDNLSPYYDPALKRARVQTLTAAANFRFVEGDICNAQTLSDVFASVPRFDRVVHLAAQPGVRYSLDNPSAYVQSNLVGFANVIEACRRGAVGHLVYASSSSVYGANTKTPFSVEDNVDHPVSLYAATKKANELMAHSYSHLFGLPTTGLRFFTVYGPWGRPDMAPWLFTSAILDGRPINVFNHGKLRRDFTFVEDIAEGVVRVMDHVPTASPTHDVSKGSAAESHAPYRVYNIGNAQPVELAEFISTLESLLGKTATKNYLPMQAGDVLATSADVSALANAVGFAPETSLADGLAKWVAWYRDYHRS
jgi:UDP-glucuronate 4-epimerase